MATQPRKQTRTDGVSQTYHAGRSVTSDSDARFNALTAVQPHFRKTKDGRWVVCGPPSTVKPGARVTVETKSSRSTSRLIASVGRPFTDSEGRELVYGYPDEDETLAQRYPKVDEHGARYREVYGDFGPGIVYADTSGATNYYTNGTDASGGFYEMWDREHEKD